MKKTVILLIIFICLSNCKKRTETAAIKHSNRGYIAESAMVVSARSEASNIGVEILAKGGNAFDAMIATHMALAVTFPFAGNLGGGGFMVYRLKDGAIGTLDFREKAPLASTSDMYLDAHGDIIENKSTIGAYAVGVPGTIAGMFAVHEKFGSLPMKDILQPVINLANNGFVISDKQFIRFDEKDSIFKAVNNKTILYSNALKPGDTCKNRALGETLKRISANGKDEFYSGETAEILVNYLTKRGGIITLEDLKLYEAIWREPVTFNYKDLRLVSMAPPSSGGVCLAQILGMIEPFDLQAYGHNSLKATQVIVEAERRAYADRSQYLGDPDFVDIPTSTLLSKLYLHDRMQSFSFESPTPSNTLSYGTIEGYESTETTHYSIVDQFGNAVSVTTTLNGAYGSKLFVDELGFFLNNEMDDFSSKPGIPNYYGLVGAEANKIEPQKRMLSSMTPTIIEKDGDLHMVLGTPGGSTIITSVMQTILNVETYNMTMQQAVDAPRFHHQWLPDEIRVEEQTFTSKIESQLEEKGYFINKNASPITAKVDAILILEDGKLEGGADYRGDDSAAGF